MKLLIKRAFKSIFKNKLFMALMFVLVFLTGFTFTMLDSSANSFKQSYNSVVVEGNLHDSLVKENFKVSSDSVLELGLYDDTGAVPVVVPIDEAAVQRIAMDPKHQVTSPGSANRRWLDIRIKNAEGDFRNIKNRSGSVADPVIITVDGNTSWTTHLQTVLDAARSIETNLTAQVESGLSDYFSSYLNDIYGEKGTNELQIKNTHSLSVVPQNAPDTAFKFVRSSSDDKVNKLIMNDGTNLFTPQRTETEMMSEIQQKIASSMITDMNKYTINRNKGYIYTATLAGGTGSASSMIEPAVDPSAYQAVVSPGYANANGKKSIRPNDLIAEYNKNPNFFTDFASDKDLQEKYAENTVWVQEVPYFIIGIGTTPDFSYPIIDEQHPTVDVNKQATLFVNNMGYLRAFDQWQTNPQENYISLKYNQNVSSDRRAQIDNEIQQILLNGNTANFANSPATQYFNNIVSSGAHIPTSFFPKNIIDDGYVVTSADDPTDVMLLAQERTSVLNTLQNTINTLSIATTFLLVLFVSAIVVLVFNVLFAINRKSLATMVALGYSKTKIAFSTAFISLVIGLLPTIIGYGVGFGAQYLFIDSFSSFWTLPAYGDPFSFISFIVVVGIPFLFLGLLIFIIILLSLRHPVHLMLKDSVKEESILLAKMIAPMKFLGARGKYAFALTFKNAGKLTLAGLTMSISLIALMVGFSTIGVSTQAYNETQNMNKYSFGIDLYSPTREGGGYNIAFADANGGLITTNPISQTYDDLGNPLVNTDEPHWHVPSVGDGNYGTPSSAMNNLLGASQYLRNKLQIKVLLDNDVVTGMNPWTIASSLMPENQKNILEEDAIFFTGIDSNNRPTADGGLQKIFGSSSYSTTADGLPPKRTQGMTDEQYNDLMLQYNIDKLIFMLTNPDPQHPVPSEHRMPYIISYDTVIMDSLDETYTYMDTSFVYNDITTNYHIIGLNENTKMVGIPHDELVRLNTQYNSDNSFIPVYVNKFIAEYLNLSTGSIIDNVTIKNHVDKNVLGTNGEVVLPPTVSLRVEGIVDGYDDGGIFTTQEIANDVIGLEGKDFMNAFNGVFTSSDSPSILNTMPLYSPSGLYLGIDKIYGQWENVLDQMLADPQIWNHPELGITNTAEFVSRYSRTPFVGATTNVHWQEINKMTFKTTSDMTGTLIGLAEGISITLSIIFMSIVSMLMFSSNKKKMATLWTIGFRRREIFRIFLGTYVLPMIFAILIAVPLTFGILEGLRFFIMGFGHILIPITLPIWVPFVAIAIVMSIFTLATFISSISQRPAKSLAAFKE